jgi:hypothetical protein
LIGTAAIKADHVCDIGKTVALEVERKITGRRIIAD